MPGETQGENMMEKTQGENDPAKKKSGIKSEGMMVFAKPDGKIGMG